MFDRKYQLFIRFDDVNILDRIFCHVHEYLKLFLQKPQRRKNLFDIFQRNVW